MTSLPEDTQNNPLELPDPLIANSGEAIQTRDAWLEQRRPEILELFRTHVFGRTPPTDPAKLSFVCQHEDPTAMEGRATLKMIDVIYEAPFGKHTFPLVLFIPNKAPRPCPGFLLINIRSAEDNTDPLRKIKTPYWPAEEIIERGFAAATFHKNDIAPDNNDHFREGILSAFQDPSKDPEADSWKAIGAWAWAASRAIDYLVSDEAIDHTRIGLVGHSRGGKTSLWAGAQDERFSFVVSNNSGCTGAAIARRRVAETVYQINSRFPFWFADNYRKFNDREDAMPHDQHFLISLIAPRPVYIASASEDQWADPIGEFLGGLYAESVYNLFGLKGLQGKTMPEPGGKLHGNQVGYHLREGKHGLTEFDWRRFMDFIQPFWQ